MPCPHFEVSLVKRSTGKSAVAGAAYQSGTDLYSEYQQRWKRYRSKSGVVHTEILLPRNAPDAYRDRGILWNAVEKAETQWNAQLARRIIMALPVEVPSDQYPEMVRAYCQKYFVTEGMCCDFAIHDEDKEPRNPHAHILLTLRSLDDQGKWLPKCKKVYDLDGKGNRMRLPSGEWASHRENVNDWNNPQNCEIWRHGWEMIQNEYLEKNQRTERVDLRSYQRQDLPQIPTVHMGRAACAMEARGEKSYLGELNRDIQETNKLLTYLRRNLKKLREWLAEKMETAKERKKEQRLEKNPPINEYLYSWILIRNEERSHWKSRKAALKRMAGDMSRVTQATAFLKEQKIFTVEDMKTKLDELEKETIGIDAELKKVSRRMKNISGILDASQTLRQYQSIHDQYSHIFFKGKKTEFYQQHQDELKQYGKVYRYLMKVHGGIVVDAAVLQSEHERLTAHQAKLETKLEGIKPILDQLRNVKRCVDMAMRDAEREFPSILEQLETKKREHFFHQQNDGEENRLPQSQRNGKKENTIY